MKAIYRPAGLILSGTGCGPELFFRTGDSMSFDFKMSLYSRLFKYAQSQKENFLTDALCDLLNRLAAHSGAAQVELLRKVFVYDGKEPVQFCTRFSTNGYGFPDLVGFVGNDVAIVVEVKIDAALTETFDTDNNKKNQLKRYAEWLRKENIRAPLVLLTAWRKPPDGFMDADSADYEIPGQCHVLRWSRLYRELQKLDRGVYVPELMDDFLVFLSQRGLGADMPKQEDFKKLEAYIADGTPNRIQGFMDTLREHLINVAKSCGKSQLLQWGEGRQIQAGGTFYKNAPSLGNWVNLKGTGARIAWGLYFPPRKGADSADPFGFHAGFGIPRDVPGLWLNPFFTDTDKAKQHIGKSALAEDWHHSVDSHADVNAPAVAFRPLDAFDGNADHMQSWFEDRFREALHLNYII